MKKLKKLIAFSVTILVVFLFSIFLNDGAVYSASKVNINTADIAELDTLPEIGPSTAQKIITYRETSGLFIVIEDIMKVSGIKDATFAKIKDYITVSDDSSSGDDGDDGDDTEAGTTTATTTATTTTATTSSANTVTIYSVHYIQEDLSDYDEPTFFEISAGRNRLAYVGLPINFEAKYKLSRSLESRKCNYIWTFGDGLSQAGEKVEHIYKNVGDYNLVLNGKCGEWQAVSRAVVKVLEPELSILTKPDGAVEITNRGKYEINLYKWKLKSANKEFVFPLDTIISANQSVIFPAEHLNLPVNNGIALVDFTDRAIVQTPFLNQDLSIDPIALAKFVLEYQRLTELEPTISAKVPLAVRVNSDRQNNVVIGEQNSLAKKSNLLTASVAVNFVNDSEYTDSLAEKENESEIIDPILEVETSSGFWNKLFHPVRTIKESFYK